MRKIVIVIALILLMPFMVQCTDEEEVEAAVSQSQDSSYRSGEEGDQELDDVRD